MATLDDGTVLPGSLISSGAYPPAMHSALAASVEPTILDSSVQNGVFRPIDSGNGDVDGLPTVEPGEPSSDERFLKHKLICRAKIKDWHTPVPTGFGVVLRDGQIVGVYRSQMEGCVAWEGDFSVDVVENEQWHIGIQRPADNIFQYQDAPDDSFVKLKAKE